MEKKFNRIRANIEKDKSLKKQILNSYWYGTEDDRLECFIDDCHRYAKAISGGRMLCVIKSVSRSGMSRNISFHESAKRGGGFCYFWNLFRALGYTEARGNREYFSISGCGMDMIFHTNCTIMHELRRLGVVSKKQCAILAQMTPTTF